LVTANLSAKTHTVLLGDGAGGWSGSSTLAVPGFPWGVALEDFDENGSLDIATGIYTNPQGVHVRFGSAAGFTGTQFVAFGNSLFEAYATAADVNGDDHADLLFAYNEFASPNNLQYLQVRLGNGAGAFGPILTSKVAGQFTNHMVVGDLTRDGLADVLVSNSNLIGGNVALLSGLGDGTFEPVVSAVAGKLPEHVAISDLDGNGLPDFVTAVGGSQRVTLHRDLSKPPAGTRVFGTGTPGCQGTLSMASNTAPRTGTPGFGLTVANAPTRALLSVWITNAADFAGTDLFGLGVLLHVDPILATRQLELTTLSDSSGLAFAPISIPNMPSLVNGHFFAQGLAVWPAGTCAPNASGLSSSRGLAIVILP
jgi:hypothetical protein